MNTLEILFFVLLFIVFYTYVGYGILLWILVKIKQSFISRVSSSTFPKNVVSNALVIVNITL